MQYLKTSKQSHAAQPAPDFNCGWSALNLLNSWTVQAAPSRKRTSGANQDERRPARDAGEQVLSGHVRHHYS
ncbi:hypothetical protein HFO21_32745 [Rhizobium laguerreae]|uniref:hypothetical protein n=1 Tax=Rhizobium laguerreae TaxID=1076926 RepID=UPI001C91C401|nr:hypothetical protein [Rhizobium laguerreae]MBY3219077.1 hypothetical protein [Rhizobium laguerreae]